MSFNMMTHGFDDEQSSEHSCNILLMVPAYMYWELYVDDASNDAHVPLFLFSTEVHHIHNLASVSKENKWCTSQHAYITIVELVHRLHGKTHIFLLNLSTPVSG